MRVVDSSILVPKIIPIASQTQTHTMASNSPESPLSNTTQNDPASPPELSSPKQPNSPTTSQSVSPKKSNDQTSPNTSENPQSSGSTTTTKKKKKRKSNRSLNDANPLPNEESIRGDGIDQWRARANNRKTLYEQTKAESSLLRADLTAALARVADAEHMEKMVNKGLVTAKGIIHEKDRALADLNSLYQNLKGDHVKLTEEKKRAEKRLIILKTVSANLQEMKEKKEQLEKKLEESGVTNAKLKKEIQELDEKKVALEKEIKILKKGLVDLGLLKKEYKRVQSDLACLQVEKEELKVMAKRDSLRAAGFGAASMLALNITLRVLTGGRKKDEE